MCVSISAENRVYTCDLTDIDEQTSTSFKFAILWTFTACLLAKRAHFSNSQSATQLKSECLCVSLYYICIRFACAIVIVWKLFSYIIQCLRKTPFNLCIQNRSLTFSFANLSCDVIWSVVRKLDSNLYVFVCVCVCVELVLAGAFATFTFHTKKNTHIDECVGMWRM